MICIIEPAHKTVWGIGKTREEAWEEAYRQIEEWKVHNPDYKLSSLDVAKLRKGARLESGGLELWAWVNYSEPYQETLL